jgi:hypothetical protein
MCSNHPQYFLSNQSRVTISSYAKIWYSEGGWSGVVTMPHIKAHGMVDLHPILIYTKSVQLWEAMDVLPSPSTPSIQSIKGYWAFVCKNMVFWGYWSGVVPSLPYPKANVMVNLHPLCTYNKFAQLQEAINVLPSPSTSSSPPPSKGHCTFVCKKYDILRVVEVVWCHCHTSTPMAWCIYIQYWFIPSLCNSGWQWMCSHHPQRCPSNQARVTEPGYARIWYSEGGWSGVVPLTYPKANVMVNLRPLCTYTKSMQLGEAINVLPSPSTTFIHSSKGHCSLVCEHMIFWGWLKWCGAIAIPRGPCHGGFISTMDLYQVCVTPGSN